LLVIVGIIHLLPLSGMLSPARLTALYGLSFEQTDLAILMRHRAVLLGTVGLLALYAVIDARLQPAALAVGAVSVLSFLAIALSTGGYNSLINRVVIADVVALVCLLAATALYVLQQRRA
jgi:hypothetical protein